jgi:adenylate cyclase
MVDAMEWTGRFHLATHERGPDRGWEVGVMRISVRLALAGFVLASIIVTVALVDTLWRRTAEGNSRTLAATINEQIVSAVQSEMSQIATQGRSAYWAIHTLFFQHVLETREADKREFVFLSQLQAQPSLSWIAFGWPDGDFFAARKLGDEQLEMMEIDIIDGERKRRVDRYKVFPNDIEFRERVFEPTGFSATGQPWYASTIGRDGPHWVDVVEHPSGHRPALAFAGPVDVFTRREGVLAVMIEHNRLSRFLAGLSVGASGAAFILEPDGQPIAVPDAEASELMGTRFDRQPLLSIAQRAVREASLASAGGMKSAAHLRLLAADGEAYGVQLTPLAYSGWTLATVIPESEFLGEIDATMRRLSLGIVMLVLAAGALSVWLGRGLIARPLAAVAGQLDHVERFELDRISYRPSRLLELDDLSKTIARMANGLDAFRKYLPADVVRLLIKEGIAAQPGGSRRNLSILFADVAGFTGLSERLGERIVPLLSAYLELTSQAIQAERGTIDKFIGDAVMAFWGAPEENPRHAAAACRAALRAVRTLGVSGLVDDNGAPLGVRIGIDSGDVVVGNIGSQSRLNYTVIGDAVNVASRLESANKRYGTAIILGEETRRLAGDSIIVRQLDRVAVYGRLGGTAIYELVGAAGEPIPAWIAPYEDALAHYGRRDFETAIALFEKTILLRGSDEPSRLMIERCTGFMKTPPSADWDKTTMLETK